MVLKFYNNLSLIERRKYKQKIEIIKGLRKEQIKELENTLLKYLKDNIKDIDKTLKNDMTLEEFYLRTKNLNKFMEAFNNG